jgi:cation transport ATPase
VAGARNKEQAIRRWQDGGVKVAMVGDGLNDAAALAQADCGLAMHSGTGLAHHAAHVLILGQRLEPLPKALSLARRTLNIIHQNLGWALGYNLVGIPSRLRRAVHGSQQRSGDVEQSPVIAPFLRAAPSSAFPWASASPSSAVLRVGLLISLGLRLIF